MTEKERMHNNDKVHRRTKTGCQPCKQRKKKCDEVHPTCSGCARNDIVCQWPSPMTASSDLPQRRQRIKRRLSRAKAPQLTPGLLGMVTVFAVPSVRILERLFSHFSEYGPLWLSIGPGGRRTSFLGHIVPIALHSPLVLNCIFAVAAADLTKYNAVERDLDIVSLEMQSKAITELSDAIGQEISRDSATQPHFGTSDELLLAVLLLCLHEAQNFSDNSRLLPHVNAAATLCWRCLQNPPTNPELREFLLALFCYFFSLAAFSHGANLSKEPAAEVFAFLLGESRCGTTNVLFLGPGERMLWTIFRVSTLATQESVSRWEDEVRRLELMGLETELEAQKILAPAPSATPHEHEAAGNDTTNTSQPPTYGDDDRARDKFVVFELYRLACILYIKRTLDPHIPLEHPDLQNLLTSFLTHLAVLPEASFVNGILGWPLVVVGLCSLDVPQQRVILARLRIIHRTWRTDIFSQNIEFLRAHWKKSRVHDATCHSGSSDHHHQDGPGSAHFTFQSLEFPTILV
ncbi:fungal-specific transcription factor domain-containing protein [Aspergillus pseudoustus]|uniref:Fungal-specific transcription factor domain-containing protein n=1 Tax=Aspergillus pseudoustus TaxID=1810923 RepID=A0ABR4IMS8_9EURO